MSRAHMLYNDTAISKVFNIKRKEWREEAIFRFKEGRGATIEGRVSNKWRVSVTDASCGKVSHRYSVLDVGFSRAYKRSFDASGVEIEPWNTATKKVNTGYLMSSYKTVDVQTTAITFHDLMVLVNISMFDDILPKVGANTVRVYCNESSGPSLELEVGESIRIKTKGNGPYVEYVARIDEGHVSSSECKGDSQASWTDKIMSMKGQEDKMSEQPDGVDESEWDD